MPVFSRRSILAVIGWLCFAAPDAGAQSASTQAATGVTDISATLNATVTPGSTTNYRYARFEFGTTADYGSSVNGEPFQIIGLSPIAITASPPGLLPETTHHYRVILSTSQNGGGWENGVRLQLSDRMNRAECKQPG